MYLTCVVDVSNYILSIGVLRLAFHLDNFDGVADFYLFHNVLLNGFLMEISIKLTLNIEAHKPK